MIVQSTHIRRIQWGNGVCSSMPSSHVKRLIETNLFVQRLIGGAADSLDSWTRLQIIHSFQSMVVFYL